MCKLDLFVAGDMKARPTIDSQCDVVFETAFTYAQCTVSKLIQGYKDNTLDRTLRDKAEVWDFLSSLIYQILRATRELQQLQ